MTGHTAGAADGMPRPTMGGSTAPEIVAVSKPPCWPCCEVGHSHAVALARELSYQLIREANTTRYSVHGLFGIFADGDRINYQATGRERQPFGRVVYEDYQHVKTKFIYSRLCQLAHSGNIRTICEIGFNAGLSAILLLESSRSARVLSFDLGDFKWARRADALMREHYGDRFPGVVFGDSAKTLRQQAAREPAGKLQCDAAFIDGAKTFAGRLAHIQDIRSVSPAGTRIFLDEITSLGCVDGSLYENQTDHRLRCQSLNGAYYEPSRAYSHAVQQGMMRILECDWPQRFKETDGICMAELL